MKRLIAGLLLATVLGVAAPASAAPNLSALQTRAQAGDADAQFQLGEAYRSGKGVTADPETAIMWYRRATAQGHIRASEELGFALFAHGDRHEAMPFIEKAAARGEARAFYLLGTAHFNGDYATRDWPLAYAQTERAASAGLSAAQKNLELMDRYLLPSDKARAEQILATLPVVRGSQTDNRIPVPAPAKSSTPTQIASTVPTPSKSGKPAKAGGAIPTEGSPASSSSSSSSSSSRTKTANAETDPGTPKKGAKAEGDWKVQLGAFGSEARVQERWKTLKAKVPELGSYRQHVVSGGTVQRLQATGIAGKADAQTLCKKVVAAGGDCLVMAP